MARKIFEILRFTPFSRYEELRELVREALNNAKIPEKIIYETVMLVDENISNIVEHSYSNKKGSFRVKIFKDKKYLILEIEDKGPAFYGVEKLEDIDEEKIFERERGLGLHIIHKLADKYEYLRKGKKNIKRFLKNLE